MTKWEAWKTKYEVKVGSNQYKCNEVEWDSLDRILVLRMVSDKNGTSESIRVLKIYNPENVEVVERT